MCTHGYLYFPYAHFPPSIFLMRIVRTSRLPYMLVVSYLIITPFQKACSFFFVCSCLVLVDYNFTLDNIKT